MDHRRVTFFLWLLALLLLAAVAAGCGTPSQACCGTLDVTGTVQEIRTLLPSEWGVPHPAGLSYSFDADQLYLLQKRTPDQVAGEETYITIITPYEEQVGTISLDFPVDDPVNVTFDDGANRLILLNNALAQLAYIEMGSGTVLNSSSLTRVDIANLGLGRVQGVDVDFEDRQLFFLDSDANQIVSVDLDAQFELVSRVDISHLGANDLRGITVHPVTRNLFVVGPAEQTLYELTAAGQLVNSYDVRALDLIDPGGLDFGPSADLTDPAGTLHLFIADSNLSAGQTGNANSDAPLLARTGNSTAASGPTGHAAQAETTPVMGRILEVTLDPEEETATVTAEPTATAASLPIPAQTATQTLTPGDGAISLAVIGDYGEDNTAEARVAALVEGWKPDYVITTGDNNYPDGEASTIDENIGQYYSQFIGNYQGAYGPGNPSNRFWPSLGNHDWHTITCTEDSCSGAYFDYFTLPNNERYYDVDLGLVHLFALDSDGDEPDGRNQNSIQADWLRNQLATSDACYNLVYFHHPPYSSGRHGSNESMQWPFSAWGADAVLSGHDHLYERLDVSGTPYFVNGAGGASLYDFENLDNLPPEVTSIVRYNLDHGAMLVTATSVGITYQFYNADGVLIDDYSVSNDCGAVITALPLVYRGAR